MATHQRISGTTDEAFVQRMVRSYTERYDEPFWSLFTTEVAPFLPPSPVIVDLGCGPALFLRDLATRYPQATLYGFDVTPAMVAYGKQLDWPGTPPTLALYDVTAQPLPLETASVRLLTMMSVLHLFDDPLQVLAEIQRVLAPGAIFFLRDWVRCPLKDYLARHQSIWDEAPERSRLHGFRLFPVHNKYTVEDWQWLLEQAGFVIRSMTQLHPTHRIFVTTPAPDRTSHMF
jgi:ubiquinone/menaquinone biosynthesis C-methylase UbiE